MCEHPAFESKVDVRKASDGVIWVAFLEVRCASCRTRFAFKGVDEAKGLDPRVTAGEPTVSLSRLELGAPIEPDGHMTSMMASVGAPWQAAG